jgi:hypothetical protein
MALRQLLRRFRRKTTYDSPVKRGSASIIYPPDERPVLKIQEHALEVVNISEEGMKFLNLRQIKFGKRGSGTVILSNGKSMDIAGKIVWEPGKEVGLFATPISNSIIYEEVRSLLGKESVRENKKITETKIASPTYRKVLNSDVKDIAVTFWKYMNKDSKETFLDADIQDATQWVLNFLNQDVVGKKIIFEDEKLKTAGVIARAFKRKRSIIKTDKQIEAIAQVKTILEYLNSPFWQNNPMVGRSKKYLENHLRRMTPVIIEELTATVEKLQVYYNGIEIDDSILITDRILKQMAMSFGFTQFGVCERHRRPLVKDKKGNILCIYTECSTVKCPFEAIKAHRMEANFLLGLGKLLTEKGFIKEKEKDRD